MMSTRYTLLRAAVANLAAPADAQVSYLDRIFPDLADGRSAEGYGNDELALEFDDSFVAVRDMLHYGEIKPSEIAALQSLDDLLTRWSGKGHSDFWARTALFSDPRWETIRLRASEVLALLPDEPRESEYTRNLLGDRDVS